MEYDDGMLFVDLGRHGVGTDSWRDYGGTVGRGES